MSTQPQLVRVDGDSAAYDCGCTVQDRWVQWCPLHAQAEGMRETLELIEASGTKDADVLRRYARAILRAVGDGK